MPVGLYCTSVIFPEDINIAPLRHPFPAFLQVSIFGGIGRMMMSHGLIGKMIDTVQRTVISRALGLIKKGLTKGRPSRISPSTAIASRTPWRRQLLKATQLLVR